MTHTAEKQVLKKEIQSLKGDNTALKLVVSGQNNQIDKLLSRRREAEEIAREAQTREKALFLENIKMMAVCMASYKYLTDTDHVDVGKSNLEKATKDWFNAV